MLNFLKRIFSGSSLTLNISKPISNAVKKETFPTVKMRDEVKQVFSETLSSHFLTLTHLSNSDVEDIVRFIEKIEGGFVNREAWRKFVYDNYFKGKEWSWPELSFWIDYAKETDNYPKWMSKEWEILLYDIGALKPNTLFEHLTVQDVRILLTECGIEFSCPKKGMKKYFENFFINNEEAFQKIKSKYIENEKKEDDEEEKRKAMFSLLCATIEDRANNLSRLKKDAEFGITQHTEILLSDFDKDISEFGKKQNFTTVPPYVPGASVVLRSIIPEFGDNA